MNRPKNIAVIGAGIMGLNAAYALRQGGHHITMYDPDGFPAPNSPSFKAGGMLAPYGEIEHMNTDWVHAGLHGISLWADITQTIGAAHLLTRAGSIMVAHPDDDYMLSRFAAHLPVGEKDTHWKQIDPRDIAPALDHKFQNGIFLPTEAHVHPQNLMRALCTYLKNNAVVFVPTIFNENTAHDFDHVIYCNGMGAFDTDKNLRGVKGEILYVRNQQFSLPCPLRLMHPRYPLYVVPHDDHVFMIGATNIEGADDAVTLRSAMELMSALYTLHPSFGDAQIIDITAGIRPAYSDNLPRITRAANAIYCNGLFRHGYLLSPVMASCVAAMIDGGNMSVSHLFTP